MGVLITLIFFASGASALVFESLWFHQAGLALGNSVWASSLVLAGFMGGIALGNLLAARWGDRVASPLRAYGIAELAIAISGVALVIGLPHLGPGLAPLLGRLTDHPWALGAVRLAVACALLLVPSTAMGVTLPLLTRTLGVHDANFGRVLGRLYAWNTFGAVAGAVLTETHLLGALGVRGSALAAGGLNAAAALAAFALARRWPPISESTQTPVAAVASGRNRALTWLVAAALAGFTLLALEVVWLRFLMLFVESNSLCFALILATVLSGIALGGSAASHWLGVAPGAHRLAAAVVFAAGALTMAGYAAFPRLFAGLAGLAPPGGTVLALGIPLMLPVAFASGLFFTLLGAALRDQLAADAQATGALTFANTLGAALGSLAGGFLLLPVLGMEGALFVLALCYAGLGALLWARLPQARRATAVAGLAFATAAALFPFGAMQEHHLQVPVARMSNPGDRVVGVREGLLETIVYVEHPELGAPASYRMITNAYSMSATMWRARRYMVLYSVWPQAVHPNLEDALLVSYGVGTTAKALTRIPSLERIDIVDISRDVIEMNGIVYDAAEHPLSDPRTRVHIEDGRQFLLTTDRRYDLITSEPPPPQMAGVVNLYTAEYFTLLHDRLREGGMVTYWLPMHSLSVPSARSILAAFCQSFADCSLWHGAGMNYMMVGTRGSTASPLVAFARPWASPEAAEELRGLGFERPEQLGALFIGDGPWLRDRIDGAAPLVDDRPKRIVARETSAEHRGRFLRALDDVDAARERFRSSETIARLWPAVLRERSLAYFEIQATLHRVMLEARPLTEPAMRDAHRLLTSSELVTPVLWLLGSDADKQRIVAEADPRTRDQAQYQLHRGIRLVAERRYAEALPLLVASRRLPPLLPRAIPLELFALCELGLREQAQRVAQRDARGLVGDPTLRGYWSWMRDEFAIDPLRAGPTLAAADL